MEGKQLISKSSYKRGWQINLEPKPAWMAILGLVFVISVFLLVAPRLAIPIFPLGSFAVGVFFYRRYPILYVGFTWWMWFLGTFMRRLIDYRCGYITPWPYHLTPLLVTSISLATLVRYLPRTYKRDGLPFMLCFASVFYAFFIGLIRQPITDYEREILILFDWLSPILFGFHLFVNWRDYPKYRQNFQRVFLWGVLVMGIYGVFQFLVAPEWDKFFLYSPGDDTYASYMGVPEPLGIRVWSTMGNSMTFAFNLMPGLLLLLISKEKLRFPAAGFGYLAFLLSKVRTAWYSWLITLLLFVISLKDRHQLRIILAITTIVVVTIPLATMEPFSEVISSRLETFSELGKDGSLNSRLITFDRGINYALSEFIGWGLLAPGQAPTGGNYNQALFSTNDNGYLVILVSFGWFALIAYIGGIALLLFKLFQRRQLDLFTIASRTIVLGSLARMTTSNVTTEQYAMPIWGFLGIAMAAYKYYQYQDNTKQKKNFIL
ncbi:O-antigen ligase [Pleurocapsa sp. PCC 7319]|uniref:O-antigen ligase family protein n=1 Tax=Pleurocapsa sp. PCC 7319 TaxID=118161 RepID=UPI000348232F|nr:O-antigen ligase family protein [Pleurocapsa sp. PCC 7319]